MALWFSSPAGFLCCCWCVLVSWSVGCCSWCVVCVVVLLLVLFCFAVVRCFVVCWLLHVCCWCVLVVVLSVLVLVCFGWSAVLLVGCRGCVALSAFLLLVVLLLLVVSPVRCTVLVLVAPGWFMRLVVVLLVVGLLVLLSPLFLVRHDQARLWSCSWFNAECHPGWVAVWCFCSCGLWEFVPFCCYYSDVVLSLWCVEFWVCGPALHCFQLSVWSSFLSCGCFCSVVVHCAWVVLSVPPYSPASFCSPASCCFCLFVVPCCSLVGCFVSC